MTTPPEYWPAWRKANPEKMASYRERNRLRRIARQASAEGKAELAAKRASPENKARRAAYYAANREKIALMDKVYRNKPEALERTRQRRAEYKADPAVKQKIRERNRITDAARRATPLGTLRNRMRVAIRHSLKNSGNKSNRLKSLGYTVEELRTHLERQFTRGMGWHNVSEWHVDHIMPLSAFKITSESCPEFKAAWALANLRPLWKPENLHKGARRDLLL